MNDPIALLQRRRSVPPHLMSAPGPDPSELDTLLTIASRVPDHGKLAPWRFLVIEGDARHRVGDLIAEAYQADEPGADAQRIALEKNRLARAPLVIGVVSAARPHAKIPRWEQILSAGAVCMNLVTAANHMGFVTAWLTEWYAYDRRILDALGLAADEDVAGFVHIGRGSDVPSDRPRPLLADIVTRI